MGEDDLLEHISRVIDVGKPGGGYIATFPVYAEMAPNLMVKAVRLIEDFSLY
jgi:hypothetical protein